MGEVAEPGVYDGMPDAEYHADPVPAGSLSASGAKRLLPPSTPAHFRHWVDHGQDHADHFDFGHAAHLYVLGAGPKVARVDADSWRTAAARDAKEAAYTDGRVPLLAEQDDRARAMALAALAHPVAGRLFEAGTFLPEQSLFWQDQVHGVWRRARLDVMPTVLRGGRFIIVDYKTADNASPAALRRVAAAHGWHVQDSWYRAAVRALGIDDDPQMVFIAQEKSPPYLLSVIELDRDARDEGDRCAADALVAYAQCQESGVWPGYPDEPQRLSLPPWVIRSAEEYFG